MRITVLAFILTAFFAAHTTPAVADYKVATVDVNRILNESTEAHSRRKEFEARAAEAKKKIESRRSELVALEKKIKDGKLAENSKEAESLRTQARDFERFVHDNDDDLRKEFLQVNKDLTEKTLKAITAYAKAHNFDLVLDKGDKVRGPLLFGAPNMDITDQIIKETK